MGAAQVPSFRGYTSLCAPSVRKPLFLTSASPPPMPLLGALSQDGKSEAGAPQRESGCPFPGLALKPHLCVPFPCSPTSSLSGFAPVPSPLLHPQICHFLLSCLHFRFFLCPYMCPALSG